MDATRTFRHIPPAHYLVTIETFSILLSTNEKYVSGEFEASGYKWRLLVYPNGNSKHNGDGYISLYLAVVETDELPLGWQLDVIFKLFVFNFMEDKYLTIQDEKRFHTMKTEWGFPQFVSIDVLKDSCNGYIFGDCCIFGAEVFVIENSGKGECLSIIKQPSDGPFTWVIDESSMLMAEYIYSDLFTVADYKWKLLFYPRGRSTSRNKNPSLYLHFVDCEALIPDRKVYAEYRLKIMNKCSDNYCDHKASGWFSSSKVEMGFTAMVPLQGLAKVSMGCILNNDALILEAQILCISRVKFFQ